jgi:hypothetical protein
MRLRFFDFEVYPEWWMCSFGDLPDDIETADQLKEREQEIKKTFKHVRSDIGNSRDDFLKLFKDEDFVQVGYNIKKYDLTIANAVYQGFDAKQIAIINDLIINPDMVLTDKEAIRLAPFAKRSMRSVTHLDLFDSSTGSLKDKEAILGLSVEETKVPFTKRDLTEDEKQDIISYCDHDVFSSMYWYLHTVKPFVDTKLILCRKFNIPEKFGYSCTNAGLVSKALNVKRSSFPDEDRVDITLPIRIRDYCEKNLPKEVLDQVLNHKNTYKVKLFENEVVFADGGIHSTYDVKHFKMFKDDSPVLYAKSDNEYVLLNVDAGSYYPSIMIQLGTISRCITLPELFKEILEERFRIKHKKNKTKEDNDTQLADKLILNTTYGASGCKWLDLYDPYQRTRTCRFGQLFLIALACRLTKNIPTLKVVQTNTDGILVYCKRGDIPTVRTYMEEWHSVSGITLEEDYVEAIWQRDVNNYVMVKDGGKLKVKGGWVNHTIVRPGYIMISPRTAYVSGRAVCDYLTKGKDIVKTIVDCKDMMDFVITTTKGPTFNRVVYRFANGMEIPTYNYNRLIAGKDPTLGQVYKVKDGADRPSYTVSASTPEHSLLLNEDMSNYPYEKMKKEIDYMYYIKKSADQLSGSWLQLDSSGVFRTHQFDYFENQNRAE